MLNQRRPRRPPYHQSNRIGGPALVADSLRRERLKGTTPTHQSKSENAVRRTRVCTCADGTAQHATEFSGYLAWSCDLPYDARPCEGLFQSRRSDVDPYRSEPYDSTPVFNTVDYSPVRADISLLGGSRDSSSV